MCHGGLARWSPDLVPTLAAEWLPAVALGDEIGFNANSVSDQHLVHGHLLCALPCVVLSANRTHTEADNPHQADLIGVTVAHPLYRPPSLLA